LKGINCCLDSSFFEDKGIRDLTLQLPGVRTIGAVLPALVLALALIPFGGPAADEAMDQRLAAGKKLVTARDKGNCLACHAIADGELPGNIGPPLVYMQQRFPDRAQLRAQVWDATARNPNTVMPPFGRHRILSDEEIDLIVDYIHTL
jgi:sulfur-oxidizing protein SoxX